MIWEITGGVLLVLVLVPLLAYATLKLGVLGFLMGKEKFQEHKDRKENHHLGNGD